jgi:hypothetical protein
LYYYLLVLADSQLNWQTVAVELWTRREDYACKTELVALVRQAAGYLNIAENATGNPLCIKEVK